MKLKHISGIAIIAISFLTLTACQNPNRTQISHSTTDYAMGTVINQTLYFSDGKTNKEYETISDNIMRTIEHLEKDCLSWRSNNSEISKINNAQTSTTTQTNIKTFSYINEALKLAKLSDGAFDPTIGKVTRLWDIGGNNPRIPETNELNNELKNVGYTNIETDENTNSVTLNQNASLDLGAIGKGIACDEIYNLFNITNTTDTTNNTENSTISDTSPTGAVTAVGGSILVYGSKPDNSDWNIAITNPRRETGDEYLGIINIPEGPAYISTSGDYEKYFEENGIRYHHILDPKTGYPSDSGLISTTVVFIGESTPYAGLLSDGLSTACFVLGKSRSLPLLKEYGAEAIFVDKNLHVSVTSGLADIFTLTTGNNNTHSNNTNNNNSDDTFSLEILDNTK